MLQSLATLCHMSCVQWVIKEVLNSSFVIHSRSCAYNRLFPRFSNTSHHYHPRQRLSSTKMWILLWESNDCRMEPQIQPFNCQVLVPSVCSLSIVFLLICSWVPPKTVATCKTDALFWEDHATVHFFWISLNMVQLCIHKWPEFCWWWPNIGFLYKLTSRHLSNISPNWPFENYL